MYLVDTNVVSELRRIRPHGAVVAWLRSVAPEHLHLSSVTFGELQVGVEVTREQDPTKAAQLEAWIERIAESWQVIPMDSRTFRRWAQLMHRRTTALVDDAMIAATADVHGLVVVTRNVRDFRQLGSQILNPFTYGRA